MNTIRVIVHSTFRGYSRFSGRQRLSINSAFKKDASMRMMDNASAEHDDLNEYNDFDDPDSHESDFSNVGEYHKMHEREMEIEKEKLISRIVKRKYFSNKEPNMLTWSEKEKIRLLHSENPEEWTPDRLSESFPASVETVSKILKSSWKPKSIKTIMDYDRNVKNNWALFRNGKLAVEPILKAHLENFKERDVAEPDEEEMKKFLKKIPIFPKPTSKVFSGIIRDSSTADNKIENKRIPERSTSDVAGSSLISAMSDMVTRGEKSATKKSSKFYTLDKFLQDRVEKINENEMTPVDRVIIDERKRQNAESYKMNSLVMQSDSPMASLKEPIKTSANLRENVNSLPANSQPEIMERSTMRIIPEGNIETGIILREKKEITKCDDYPRCITIPKNQYKSGRTYRVQDCYYDDDGEFLYRVPRLFA